LDVINFLPFYDLPLRQIRIQNRPSHLTDFDDDSLLSMISPSINLVQETFHRRLSLSIFFVTEKIWVLRSLVFLEIDFLDIKYLANTWND